MIAYITFRVTKRRPVRGNTPVVSTRHAPMLSNTCVHVSGAFPSIGLAALRTRIFVHNITVLEISYAVFIIKKDTNRITILKQNTKFNLRIIFT